MRLSSIYRDQRARGSISRARVGCPLLWNTFPGPSHALCSSIPPPSSYPAHSSGEIQFSGAHSSVSLVPKSSNDLSSYGTAHGFLCLDPRSFSGQSVGKEGVLSHLDVFDIDHRLQRHLVKHPDTHSFSRSRHCYKTPRNGELVTKLDNPFSQSRFQYSNSFNSASTSGGKSYASSVAQWFISHTPIAGQKSVSALSPVSSVKQTVVIRSTNPLNSQHALGFLFAPSLTSRFPASSFTSSSHFTCGDVKQSPNLSLETLKIDGDPIRTGQALQRLSSSVFMRLAASTQRPTDTDSCLKRSYSGNSLEETSLVLREIAAREEADPDSARKLSVVRDDSEDDPPVFFADADLQENLAYLGSRGLSEDEVRRLLDEPSITSPLLENAVKTLARVVRFLEGLGMEAQEITRIVLGSPALATANVDDCLRPNVEYLRSRGLPREGVVKVARRFPDIFANPLEPQLCETEGMLLAAGLKTHELARVLAMSAHLLCGSSENLGRTLEFLKGVGGLDLARLVKKQPQILALGVEGKLQEKLTFLRSSLGLESQALARLILSTKVLTYSVEGNLQPKLEYFLQLGLQKEDIGRMALQYPHVLDASLELSIKPKVQYLLTVMHKSANDLKAFPNYLGYSLEDRIRPRHEHVLERGFILSLKALLTPANLVFFRSYS